MHSGNPNLFFVEVGTTVSFQKTAETNKIEESAHFRKIKETIQDYFDVYVKPNLNRIFLVSGSKHLFPQLLKIPMYEDRTFQGFQRILTENFGPKNNDLKSIFNIMWKLIRGELDKNDPLLTNLLKIDPTVKITTYNSFIAEEIEALVKDYLNAFHEAQWIDQTSKTYRKIQF